MERPTGDEVARPGGRGWAFVGLLVGYYLIYYALFAERVSEYFGDLLKHFAFIRRPF